MTELERDQLLADSDQIRDEVIPDANTETRVGTLFRNIVNFSYKAWLGITDETTHLLTPKEIREGADPETKLITLLDLPENDAKTIGLIDDKASVISWYIPTSGTAVTFDAPRSYGSWKSPRTAFTITLPEDLTDIPQIQKTSFFLQSDTLPTALTGDKVLWSGDAFSGTAGFVNLLDIIFSQEPTDDYLLLVKNTVKEVEAGPTADPTLFLELNYLETSGDLNRFFDSSQYNNHGGLSSINSPTVWLTPDPLPVRASGVGGNQAVQFDGSVYLHTSINADTAPFVQFPHTSSMVIGQNFSFSTSYYVPTGYTGSLGILSKNGRNGDSGFEFVLDTDRLTLRFNNTNDGRIRARAVDFTKDVWIHIGFVVGDGDVAKIYINGVEPSTYDLTTSNTPTINHDFLTPLCIGRIREASNSRNIGVGVRFSKTKVWSRSLSPAEMLQEYQSAFGL
jgi:hypothetical protein